MDRIVLIGGSAGSLLLMLKHLPLLSRHLPYPVCLCMHRPIEPSSAMAQLISKHLPFPLTEVHEKTTLAGNRLYLAPPGIHMVVKDQEHVSVDDGPPVCFSKPSIDVLFQSAARVFGANAAGAIVSGMNRDGAEGLRAIERAGGVALVQDPSEAQMDMMPRSAIAKCRSAKVMKTRQIVEWLNATL